jgi:hypothetical protein
MLEPARILYEACGDLLGWQFNGCRMLRWRTLASGVQRNLRSKADRGRAPPSTIDAARTLLSGVGSVIDKQGRPVERKQT